MQIGPRLWRRGKAGVEEILAISYAPADHSLQIIEFCTAMPARFDMPANPARLPRRQFAIG
jgi:hypothetical protein